MPTKKQRRRQQKARRHEYEYVYVDDEGNEVAVDRDELRTEKNGTKSDGAARRTDNRKAAARKGTQRRPIEPPSWRRSARRALILAPILVIALMLLNSDVPLAQ